MEPTLGSVCVCLLGHAHVFVYVFVYVLYGCMILKCADGQYFNCKNCKNCKKKNAIFSDTSDLLTFMVKL